MIAVLFQNRYKSILVEEDPYFLELVRYNLIREGYAVVSALSGEDALKMAISEAVDLIVLDLEMPRMNGLDACRYLKASARTADIPVVMLTQHADSIAIISTHMDLKIR